MRTSLRALLALAVASAGVAVVATTAAPAGAVACDASSAGLWRTCVSVAVAGGVVTEEVTYDSPTVDRPVTGTVCRPADAGTDAEVHPILVLNHGGFRALRPDDERLCSAWAAAGWFVLASHYRPMNVAPAGDDLCAGEVDDVLAMLAIGGRHPGADPTRVVLRGGSHGGCVTLRAYQRGVPGLVAAAAFMPLSDPASTYRFTTQVAVRDQLDRSLGGPPPTAAYESRRPAIPDVDVPLLITHGVDDDVISVDDSCRLVAGHGFVGAGPRPPACTGVDWSGDATDADHAFVVYADVGHGHGPNWRAMSDDIDAWLQARAAYAVSR